MGNMRTITIRGVPDAVLQIYQGRAAATGVSLQEYLLAEVIRGAQFPTPEEIAAESRPRPVRRDLRSREPLPSQRLGVLRRDLHELRLREKVTRLLGRAADTVRSKPGIR